MNTRTPDLLNARLWLMLAAIGFVLCLIGWYRFFR
jgi:hypothetical protein